MQDSKLNTLSVPIIGQNANPSTLVYASGAPMRVVVRNTGPTLIFISHDSNTLRATTVAAGAFRLAPGEEDVYVLAAKQGLFAGSNGAGGEVSIAMSEAIPTTSMES